MKLFVLFLFFSTQAFSGVIEIGRDQFLNMNLKASDGIYCASIVRILQNKTVLWENQLDNDLDFHPHRVRPYRAKWNLDVPQDSLKDATHLFVISECANGIYPHGLKGNSTLTLNVQTTEDEKSVTTIFESSKTSSGSTHMIKLK